MKRIAFLLLFLFPAFKYSIAQTFQAGFYIGASVSDIPGTDNIDNDVDFEHLGFVAAGTVSTQITPKTRLQMEIRFIQRGASQNPPVDSTGFPLLDSGFFKMTLNYVDVAIGIKHSIHFNLRNVATDKYGIEAGVSFGALVGYSYSVSGVNYALDLAPIDISPYIGLYYNVTPHFYVEGRYSNAINSALKHDNSNSNSFYNLYYGTWDAGHNVGFTFAIGFLFGNTPGQTGNEAGAPARGDNN